MTNQDRDRARRLLATINTAVEELRSLLDADDKPSHPDFDQLDRSRRMRPEWQRRGRVFYAIAKRGGRVTMLEFLHIILDAGYRDGRGANGFFRGDPVPVLERDGNDVVLTERGAQAARFYEEHWLPREDGPHKPES
jgi:hypothetical protein